MTCLTAVRDRIESLCGQFVCLSHKKTHCGIYSHGNHTFTAPSLTLRSYYYWSPDDIFYSCPFFPFLSPSLESPRPPSGLSLIIYLKSWVVIWHQSWLRDFVHPSLKFHKESKVRNLLPHFSTTSRLSRPRFGATYTGTHRGGQIHRRGQDFLWRMHII